MVYEEMDRYFTLGKIKTAELILDGDGTSVYLPQHIHSHYIPVALELPEEFQTRKERIAKEQEERKAQGDSYQWNGERYNLVKFNISRDPASEDMILGLWFRPSDYYTFLATSTIAQDQQLREKYLADAEWDEAIPLFAHSFSVLLTLVTADGHTILVFSVPFTPEEACSFVFSHEPFSPGGLVCLYHALVHEFGREHVNSTLSSY